MVTANCDGVLGVCMPVIQFSYTRTVLPALRPNNFGLGWSEGIVSPNFVGIVDFRF